MTDRGRMIGEGRIEFVRVFRAPRETLWAHLVEDEGRRRWLCGGEVEPRVGGRIVFDFDHRRLATSPPPEAHAAQGVVRFEGTVLAYDRLERLAFSWPEADGESTTTVTITLRDVAGGTELTLVHENLHTAEYRLGAAAGWHTHLDLLADVVGGVPVRDFWIRHTEMEELYRRELAGG